MKPIQLFKYPLFPVEAEFSVDELQERARSTMEELITLIPELGNKSQFTISQQLESGNDFLWLKISATTHPQMLISFDQPNANLPEFRQEIIEKINNLPILLNSLVLEDIADNLFPNKLQPIFEKNNSDQKKLIKKYREKTTYFEIDGWRQTVLFPSILENRVDPTIRSIECKIESLKRFEIVIHCLKDPHMNQSISPLKKFRVNIRQSLNDNILHKSCADPLYEGRLITLQVNAILSIINSQVVEYLLIEY